MSLGRLRLLIIGTTAVVLLALGLLVARLNSRGEMLAVSAAEAVVTRAADVAQSLLNRHLLQVEGQITSLAELMAQDFLDIGDGDRTSRALREMTAHSFTYRNLMIADAGGLIWASAVETRRARPLPIPLAQLQAELTPDAASIFGPMPHPQTGEIMLVMVRRISSGADRPDVLAAAEIPTALITAALGPMINPTGLRIRLERADGMILAAGPGQEELEGRALPGAEMTLLRQESILRSRNRQGEGDVVATSRPIIYPGLFAVAALPEDLALADWLQIKHRILVGGVVVAGLIVAFGVTLLIAMTARHRAALEREAASLRLRDAVESLPDGFVLWDADDRMVVSNSRYRELMGVGEGILAPGFRYEDLVRRWLARGLYRVHQPVPLEEQVATALASHRSADGYFERELADGRWLRVAKQRVADGGTVVILSEITAVRQAMAALAEARDTADRATAAKSRLLSHISHELRTPLSSLLRLSDRLGGEASLSAAQRRQAVLVGATARHLLALANEVLDLAAMEARSLTLNIAATPPADIFEEAVAMVQPLAEAKDVRLSFKAEGLPARMMADATRLRQVVLNLLANAVKFTPPGSTVRLDATAHSCPPQLRLEIADQGPGVPESERGRLFTDFTRLAPAETEGTGLGLSITARLVALMDGRIGCTDARGGTGACFWVELPLVLARAEPETVPEEAPGDPARPLRLLAVDDVPANLVILRAMLSTTGFELETVAGGPAALEATAAAAREGRPFDIVLMDVMMPGMDGIEATRRLRDLPGPAGQVPIVALTASAFPEDVETCRAAGMDAHLSKPVEHGELLRVLASLIPGKPGGAAGSNSARTPDALQPHFLAEMRRRVDQLAAAGREKAALVEALHAVAGTARHLGEAELVAQVREVLKAVNEDAPGAPEMLDRLMQVLRCAYPGVRAVEVAA